MIKKEITRIYEVGTYSASTGFFGTQKALYFASHEEASLYVEANPSNTLPDIREILAIKEQTEQGERLLELSYLEPVSEHIAIKYQVNGWDTFMDPVVFLRKIQGLLWAQEAIAIHFVNEKVHQFIQRKEGHCSFDSKCQLYKPAVQCDEQTKFIAFENCGLPTTVHWIEMGKELQLTSVNDLMLQKKIAHKEAQISALQDEVEALRSQLQSYAPKG